MFLVPETNCCNSRTYTNPGQWSLSLRTSMTVTKSKLRFTILIRGRNVCNPTISIQSYLAACRFDYLDVRLERIMVILTTHKESLELNVSSMERPLSHWSSLQRKKIVFTKNSNWQIGRKLALPVEIILARKEVSECLWVRLVHSHWSSSYITALLLVQSFPSDAGASNLMP